VYCVLLSGTPGATRMWGVPSSASQLMTKIMMSQRWGYVPSVTSGYRLNSISSMWWMWQSDRPRCPSLPVWWTLDVSTV